MSRKQTDGGMSQLLAMLSGSRWDVQETNICRYKSSYAKTDSNIYTCERDLTITPKVPDIRVLFSFFASWSWMATGKLSFVVYFQQSRLNVLKVLCIAAQICTTVQLVHERQLSTFSCLSRSMLKCPWWLTRQHGRNSSGLGIDYQRNDFWLHI